MMGNLSSAHLDLIIDALTKIGAVNRATDPIPLINEAFHQALKPRSAEELAKVIDQWLCADDATHWGDFEKDLNAVLLKHGFVKVGRLTILKRVKEPDCETCGDTGEVADFVRFSGEAVAGEPVSRPCPDCSD